MVNVLISTFQDNTASLNDISYECGIDLFPVRHVMDCILEMFGHGTHAYCKF